MDVAVEIYKGIEHGIRWVFTHHEEFRNIVISVLGILLFFLTYRRTSVLYKQQVSIENNNIVQLLILLMLLKPIKRLGRRPWKDG